MNLAPYESNIIDLYSNQGFNTVEIASMIGCSSSGVMRLLERNGIKRYHHGKPIHISDSDINSIVDCYRSGMTTIELGEKYHICDNTVAKILRERNVDIRRAVRRSHVNNHGLFHNIDTTEKAYFLGWMISDGSVVEPHTRTDRAKTISLEIASKDEYILDRFAVALNADENIVKRFEKRGLSYLRFASEEMATDLAMYGVVPRKSNIVYLPIIRQDLMSHMIRGYFDGNGTVTIDKRSGIVRFGIYGSEQICNDICNYLHDTIGLNRNKVSKSTCYHVWWGGRTPSKLFYDYIYNDCSDLYLTRKKLKFESNCI